MRKVIIKGAAARGAQDRGTGSTTRAARGGRRRRGRRRISKRAVREAARWKLKNLAYTARVLADRHPYGLDLLRCWPMRVIRALARRHGFGVVGDDPRTCVISNYEARRG